MKSESEHLGTPQDITNLKQVREALQKNCLRLELLAQAIGDLLRAADPQGVVKTLGRKIMEHLDCHVFFNFMIDKKRGCLRLNTFAGISAEAARAIELLDCGPALTGGAPHEGIGVDAEPISFASGALTDLVKSHGIKAYACHPIIDSNSNVIGTLSFGTRSREAFSPDELELMKTIADHVAVAMIRKQAEEDMRSSQSRLEKLVQKRTIELVDTVRALENEINERKKSGERLQEISRRTLQTLETDRKSVSRELHDHIGGNLAALKFILEESLGLTPANSPAAAALKEGIVFLSKTIKESKRISGNLRPLALDDMGFVPTLRSFIKRFGELCKSIKIDYRIDVREEDVSEENQIMLYRVLQESLTNIAKHSRADAIRIGLTNVDGALALEVQDNGDGFDPDTAMNQDDPLVGLGLKSMRERVEICSGQFELDSGAGRGTLLRITLPVGTASRNPEICGSRTAAKAAGAAPPYLPDV